MIFSSFILNDGNKLILVAVVAVVSIAINIYLLLQPEALPRSAPQTIASSDSETIELSKVSIGPGSAELTELLLDLRDEVGRNRKQLELLLSEVLETTQPLDAETIVKRAEWEEKHKLVREERNKRRHERKMLHLPPDERAVALHQRWMIENAPELQQLSEEHDRIEQSGIDALAAYEAKRKK